MAPLVQHLSILMNVAKEKKKLKRSRTVTLRFIEISLIFVGRMKPNTFDNHGSKG